ncbi:MULTISPECIES: hypothetical protein [Staphylococcus]|uniref:hypothetical protein n=1 Tax=Staphylococcus TaxID=1279 RepID=UPI000D1D0391|nr:MULTISPECIES: hypothetical protein [Staphylococcus]PTE35034.1 hypothetical protein BUZ00_08655 [Staphylococcus gallinarum]RIL20455.1 hypothetical protein BUY99_10470 [Staphylococcus gallinarum]RIO85203.1 hypothetical protein BUZ10_07090 [Staphylococcus gallinarum]UBV40140.1 hypothetical protein JGY87_00235 [Staphylococcus xylosus]
MNNKYYESEKRSSLGKLAGVIGHEENVRNPKYPELDFEDFISECISEKQKRIKKELDIN